jgi:hypothetical protein
MTVPLMLLDCWILETVVLYRFAMTERVSPRLTVWRTTVGVLVFGLGLTFVGDVLTIGGGDWVSMRGM